jgi:hypothetical protein
MHPQYTTNDVSRFWSKVDRSGDCWLWQAGCYNTGYGRFCFNKKCQVLAHRFAYTVTCGPIPDGIHVCHHCDVPACVRPDHLFLGTHQDNMNDMIAKGRDRKATTETKVRGEQHPIAKLTPDLVRKIRTDHKLGISVVNLAFHYNVSRKLIYNIVNRTAWAHID